MNKKILLISHQVDFSGAPVALFYLAKALTQLNWTVEIYALDKSGGLLEDFMKIGVRPINGDFEKIALKDYEVVLFNTVVTSALIPINKPRNTKFIFWIHESPFLAGFAWSSSVKMKSTLNVDLLIFPSMACRNEWEGLIDTSQSTILLSPVDIPQEIMELSHQQKNDRKIFCIIDPRESYRNISLMEEEILKYSGEATFNFVGTVTPSSEILATIKSKKNIEVNYFGRVSRLKALEILALSNIYWSATCLATQNRGFCEALVLNKSIYISRIKAHLEIGAKAGLKNNSFFYPFGELDLHQSFPAEITSTEFLSFHSFRQSVEKLFN